MHTLFVSFPFFLLLLSFCDIKRKEKEGGNEDKREDRKEGGMENWKRGILKEGMKEGKNDLAPRGLHLAPRAPRG